MRGKAFLVHHSSPPVRITPAYAGKRNGVCFCRIVHKDHPRLCGEKEPVQKHEADVQGSPPPMRGKVHTELHCGILVRITPAYAGKRFRRQRGSKIYKDHPRLCGEKLITSGNSGMGIGSPPPMRGKADRTRNKEGRNRITPAYAGKRIYKRRAGKVCWDHPRLCGEKNQGNLCFL